MRRTPLVLGLGLSVLLLAPPVTQKIAMVLYVLFAGSCLFQLVREDRNGRCGVQLQRETPGIRLWIVEAPVCAAWRSCHGRWYG